MSNEKHWLSLPNEDNHHFLPQLSILKPMRVVVMFAYNWVPVTRIKAKKATTKWKMIVKKRKSTGIQYNHYNTIHSIDYNGRTGNINSNTSSRRQRHGSIHSCTRKERSTERRRKHRTIHTGGTCLKNFAFYFVVVCLFCVRARLCLSVSVSFLSPNWCLR